LKNSTILFLVAALILVWFGSEASLAQEICVTSCISLAGATIWEEAIAVAILPALIIVGAIKLRSTEKLRTRQKSDGVSSSSSAGPSHNEKP
jgi:hypothetical protein